MTDAGTREPALVPEVAERTDGLRTGWTTGTCAAAAAKAAALGLCDGRRPGEVEVGLPRGERVRFAVEGGPSDPPEVAAVVKDAGDDPDCTDGARLTARVRWASQTSLEAGPGIGTVTRPGLGISVGAPSITEVPRRMIRDALAEVTARPLSVILSVPGGEAMAEKTSNARLGIVGGISILGTNGIVRPFSTASYRSSVVQQIDVAAAQGERQMVLSTGGRSDAFAARVLDLPDVCFVEVGDFTGIALRRAASVGMERAVFVGMAGKITKLAAGIMMTHFHRSKVDTELLAGVAREVGAPGPVVDAATETNTARHFFEVCAEHRAFDPLRRLCELASEACRGHVDGRLEVDARMVDFQGAREVARG